MEQILIIHYRFACFSIELLKIRNGQKFFYLFNRQGKYFYIFDNFKDLYLYLNRDMPTWIYKTEDESVFDFEIDLLLSKIYT
ncbi:hypothetical protein EGI24_07455 [Lacihabitans sp. CS3-21]|nr:hypothetical protein [Lacihabitans sp. CS3-21]